MVIQDCDEVFNYWEPLNYLFRNFGKQTWEYSPEYSIRSWSYLLPYYGILQILKPLNYLEIPSFYYFYAIRVFLVTCVLIGELQVYRKLKKYCNGLNSWFLFFSLINTGMAHSSGSLLPSSFAMMCNLYAISNTIEFYFSNDINYSVLAVFSYSLAGLLGWVFSLALAIPLILYTIFSSKKCSQFLLKSAVLSLSLLLITVGVDSFFYKKFPQVVPLNIFFYNVIFADENMGPNIFGTEPFVYYINNLLINFNFIFIMALLNIVLLPNLKFINFNIMVSMKKNNPDLKTNNIDIAFYILMILPLLLWCAVFGTQPHKEERFLYPIYPLISISAATLVFEMQTLLNYYLFDLLVSFINISIAAVVTVVSLLRSHQLIFGYSAPLRVYESIPEDSKGNVCVGREWYRFPSSFFIPNENTRLQFVRSEFDGLLPGTFSEDGDSKIDNIAAIPKNMNNMNLFEEDKIVDFAVCDYYIDIDIKPSINEVELLKNGDSVNENWEVIHCEQFLNSEESLGVARLIYVPSFARTFVISNLKFNNYCLLKKKVNKKN